MKGRHPPSTLSSCTVCPRECGANRLAGEHGTCETGSHARVASAFAHHGEEAVLSGTRGSGTIFFSGCNLHCVFCQNHDISEGPGGTEVSDLAVAGLMLELAAAGCHNVNLVTPSHVVPQVARAIRIARDRGLAVPVVWNSSAYDSVESLRRLEGLVQIWMPDFKFWTADTAGRYAAAPDYPDRARAAIREMHRQGGDLVVGADGVATRGLLVRHLVMPGLAHESVEIVRWLAREISPDTFVNVMDQYRPAHRVNRTRFPEIDRRPTTAEIEEVLRAARAAGLSRFA